MTSLLANMVQHVRHSYRFARGSGDVCMYVSFFQHYRIHMDIRKSKSQLEMIPLVNMFQIHMRSLRHAFILRILGLFHHNTKH